MAMCKLRAVVWTRLFDSLFSSETHLDSFATEIRLQDA